MTSVRCLDEINNKGFARVSKTSVVLRHSSHKLIINLPWVIILIEKGGLKKNPNTETVLSYLLF